MSEFTLIFYDPGDTQAARLERAVSLTLTRERYTPFYTLEYSFIADDPGADINDFVSVRLLSADVPIIVSPSNAHQNCTKLWTISL